VSARKAYRAHGVADGVRRLPASVGELAHPVRITTRPITRRGNPVSFNAALVR
jgi:hypothetical protein